MSPGPSTNLMLTMKVNDRVVMPPGVVQPRRVVKITSGGLNTVELKFPKFTLRSDDTSQPEIILDYERAEKGQPIFQIEHAASSAASINFQVFYSESLDAVYDERGDGPSLLFSNAMDTYRSVIHDVAPTTSARTLAARHAQCSQRYQRIRLLTPNASISFSMVGFWDTTHQEVSKSMFRCSDHKLNKIWKQGVRTISMCTVQKNETVPAWDTTTDGTRIYGQHWAPCRQGTRWMDSNVKFEVRIEHQGASWGVYMVANGLVFCLDKQRRTLVASEGLSHEASVFPAVERGRWMIDNALLQSEWLAIETVTRADCASVSINGITVASVSGLNLHPLVGGSENNSGSVAFGGPCGWIGTYRNLLVTDARQSVLYSNSLLRVDEPRTFADFAVGTNDLPCLIDGAKRDRAVFGGDLHISGRAALFSGTSPSAILGSIELLLSHQTSDGYLGNLCPIQAPKHMSDDEPPTYAFYSMSYALLLIVAVKDYWLFTGDTTILSNTWPKAKNMIQFAERFADHRGLIAAPPPLSCEINSPSQTSLYHTDRSIVTFFPLGGPVFGTSAEINLAFYDALMAMALIAPTALEKQKLMQKASALKQAIVQHLWSEETGIVRMSDSSPATGLCAHVNAYGMSLGVSPSHQKDRENLVQPSSKLPPAFRGLEARFDSSGLCSPYSAAFAVEACFKRDDGLGALNLLDRVWGMMVDKTSPDYSGGLWEAMTMDGQPLHKDTSLMHAWSASPVYLMPMYLAGVRPLKAGWKEWEAAPVFAGLEEVEAAVETPAGLLQIHWTFSGNGQTCGFVSIDVPKGTKGYIQPPKGWLIGSGDRTCEFTGSSVLVDSGKIRLLLRQEK
ncbi:unnamed protein product [Aureobasidium uvarum]|uniref:Alpha-L-rhamnosidase C-terminal domain-containing protein n=1 Tax=Aureobasidium uvarum TaxID=2773716 RepID=A0A9N8KHB3_9PEZI|nr:unnamed protein product [Aureobasidium uvarum]